MMSEYYDHYHRWEPLAEFHFQIGDEDDDYGEENYVYCLCSRAFIKDGVKTYYVEKEEGSESDVEVTRDSHSQHWDEHSHVHFSLDTSYKVKCEKDEGASCYCSASHTDNYCSTDEHDPAQVQGMISHALQPSDSGADLTYPESHSDYTTNSHDILEKMEQDLPNIDTKVSDENYLSENTFEKFWAVNGERLIWASWIKNYSDYINPSYLDQNNDLLMDDNNIPKQRSADQIYQDQQVEVNKKTDEDDGIRERKFSYDSKVNPYKKNKAHPNPVDKVEETEPRNRDDPWLPLARKRSCSEHDRILSPRTVTGTDSMTNVTKITISSYDVSSSHVTSESSPTEDYSMSSTTSDDQSNDQTRIANVDEILEQPPSEELDTDQYWQFLWKKHFGEQYALHYANYLESHEEKPKEDENKQVEAVVNIPDVPNNVDKPEEKVEVDHENSEGNSQETPTIIEVLTQVNNIKLEEKNKPKRRIKKNTNRIIGSVGMLLQSLLKDEQKLKELCELNEVNEAAEAVEGSTKTVTDVQKPDTVDGASTTASTQQSISNTNLPSYKYDDGDDDPPEDKPVMMKKGHEVDEEEAAAEEVTNTFDLMGFCVNAANMPKGRLIYKKRVARLRPRHKRFVAPRKTYFDDEGNPCQVQESHDEREMQTDDEGPEIKSDNEKPTDIPNVDSIESTNIDTVKTKDNTESEDSKLTNEAAAVPLPSDMSGSFSSAPENSDEHKGIQVESKRRRRQKRHSRATIDDSEIPAELRETPKMLKYWKKRHSLFHRFDEGIKLDLESWFSVTPESVAWHIANKFAFDIVIDAFCGAGGNTIQFARTCKKVIAIDIDPVKVEMARHNATVYGVADRIEFRVGDFFTMAPQLEADMVFLSPPWGGPNYSENYEYDLETMLEPKPASELMDVARNITTNIALYLPRNTRSDQIITIAKEIGSSVEVEQSYLDKRFVAITAYFYQNNEL
ncbi:unnamed protein product [Chilo suppressalis]|uniref:Trimethylguanosine synthase n=1 Tax=Chilo suppressalis TaxID=168631 RepID=A0ABN8AV76_CHISP|nr:unnamed protein product [Chilo suppressalis]